MSRARIFVAGTGVALALGACASTGSTTAWAPREGANLSADKAACVKEAQEVDMRSASGYSDPRYGAAAAMAGRMDRSDNRGAGVERLYAAIEDACMRRKGWTPAQ